MSANDVIVVEKFKDTYVVRHMDVENHKVCYDSKTFKSLKDAIQYAKRLQDKVHPEYGVYLA